ncbi:hypothetical protein [Haliangium ochraceum]|uniref:PE-PGRS family protein n=1 Tax=Haliangium ochraceum (strain DSM 14365 / JCM 11303 / SMP-2) TaxID=502025 RepID=D0LG30_HALO1|nr:hypothetical protein [Haliangium ochraceum]ACY14632.1 hypothetical protein Hoch_2087 [Haliangium ochraceum DSM 14365]
MRSLFVLRREAAAALVSAAALAACTFSPSPLDPVGADGGDAPDTLPAPTDGGPDGTVDAPLDAMPDAMPDARPSLSFDVAHVPDDRQLPGFDTLTLGTATIDTSALTVDGQDYPQSGAGIFFESVPQEGGGPELAVLHLGRLELTGGTVSVTGSRPLVVIAQDEIIINGELSGAANLQTPGPGGFLPGEGEQSGAGGDGSNDNLDDGGGGGAGHATAGARGGHGDCGGCDLGGAGGQAYGDQGQTRLFGGSGGGAAGNSCDAPPGGAGGGAIQLTAGVRIEIGGDGSIHVGGGGGSGGSNCPGNAGGGGGGGAGGSIYLQAPVVNNVGTLAANGGGGGSGRGNTSNPGQNGKASTEVASGGSSGGGVGGNGGCGGASGDSSCPQTGEDNEANGGGGGGAVGRIAVSSDDFSDSGTTSPGVQTTGL